LKEKENEGVGIVRCESAGEVADWFAWIVCQLKSISKVKGNVQIPPMTNGIQNHSFVRNNL
jgi:hypothetical protein